jgi:hypothetical protein
MKFEGAAASDNMNLVAKYSEGWKGTPTQLLVEINQRTAESTRKARS